MPNTFFQVSQRRSFWDCNMDYKCFQQVLPPLAEVYVGYIVSKEPDEENCRKIANGRELSVKAMDAIGQG